MNELVQLETTFEGLYASTPEQLPFAPSLDIRAFLLRRDPGNLLVYSATGLESDAPAIEGLGGISRHYLNHRHEAMFASGWLAAPLFVHVNERESVAGSYSVAGTFSERHVLDEDFEVIPTPGHTSGATAYLWDSGENRFLFTGDTVYLHGGEWVAAVLAASDRALPRGPRAHPRARLRRARPVGGHRRPALLRRDELGGRAAPHRPDYRTGGAG
jgi:glyoxylase-like metal-dependent hydrolase (beta-lactamase superfamily II)